MDRHLGDNSLRSYLLLKTMDGEALKVSNEHWRSKTLGSSDTCDCHGFDHSWGSTWGLQKKTLILHFLEPIVKRWIVYSLARYLSTLWLFQMWTLLDFYLVDCVQSKQLTWMRRFLDCWLHWIKSSLWEAIIQEEQDYVGIFLKRGTIKGSGENWVKLG